MILKKKAKDTLTPVELDHGDLLEFTLADGRVVTLKLLTTGGGVLSTDLPSLEKPVQGARTIYSFYCEIEVNQKKYRLEREIPTAKSFYDPWVIDGLTIWFDAVSDIFAKDGGFLVEKDSRIDIYCRPNKKARFAVQDAALEICPVPLHPWCPLPEGGLDIKECYRGEDCWMGPYNGIRAHGGLDINHPKGTPLWAPLDFDEQYYFNSLEMGHNNNRWRGIHNWENGAVWVLQAHHMVSLTMPEHTPVKRGEQIAVGAGVYCDRINHSHFVFRVDEDGESYFLDPWILFWKMYKDSRN